MDTDSIGRSRKNRWNHRKIVAYDTVRNIGRIAVKAPFYMTYPLQSIYETELEYEKDIDRIREYYPRSLRRILELVEERCDELECEGSRMYDENPDRYMLEREVDIICKRCEEKNIGIGQEWKDIVSVLFYNELYRRRCRFRRCHKWW